MNITIPELAGLTYGLAMTAVAVGLGIASFRRGKQNAQAIDSSAQAQAIQAMQAQIQSQKDTIAEQTTKISTLETKVLALETFNRQLADLLAGRPDWARITAALEAVQTAQEAHAALGQKIALHLGVE